MARWRARPAVVAAALLVALGGVGTGTQASTVAGGSVQVPAGADVVGGRYIVTLAKGSPAASAASAVAGRYGGRVLRTYRAALNGFVLSATEAEAGKLAADPAVVAVEADTVVRGAAARLYPQWNLDRVDQRSSVLDESYAYPNEAGTGVTAYVLDTGIRTDHTQFGDRASVGFDAVADGHDGQDCSDVGHGTHVAGLVGGATFGVAPGVRLVSVRVLGCDGFGTVSQVIAGVDWVTQNAQRPAVANMSLGGGKSTAEETAVRNSIAAGITYVIAAGNREQNACNFSPSGVTEAIVVGASNSIDERATGWGFPENGSNTGTCLDLFAPGQDIKSASIGTTRATAILRGTSMAAPHVAGAAALLLSRSAALTPAQVGQTLVNAATVNGLRADNLGSGSPNRLLFTSDAAGLPLPAVR